MRTIAYEAFLLSSLIVGREVFAMPVRAAGRIRGEKSRALSRAASFEKEIVKISSGALAGRVKIPLIPEMGQIGWERCAGKEESIAQFDIDGSSCGQIEPFPPRRERPCNRHRDDCVRGPWLLDRRP